MLLIVKGWNITSSHKSSEACYQFFFEIKVQLDEFSMNFMNMDTRLDNTDCYKLLAGSQDSTKGSPGPSPPRKLSKFLLIRWYLGAFTYPFSKESFSRIYINMNTNKITWLGKGLKIYIYFHGIFHGGVTPPPPPSHGK